MSDDGTMTEDSPLKTWVRIFDQIGEKIGNPFFWDPVEAFQEAGLQNISERKVKVPIGTWPKNKDLKQWGAWNRQFLMQGLEGFSIRGLTELLGVCYSCGYLVCLHANEWTLVGIRKGASLSCRYA